MADSIKRIQVPNKYIDNKDFTPDNLYLYITLKLVCMNNKVHIYARNLLDKLGWSNYKLKKNLMELKKEKLIKFDFESIPRHKPMEITLTKIRGAEKEYFTQVDTETIFKIIKQVPKEKEKALKLFYLYEMYYNAELKKCYLSYEQIRDGTRITNVAIKKVNTWLNKEGIVKVILGKWYEKETEQGTIVKMRERNNYVPKCNRREK